MKIKGKEFYHGAVLLRILQNVEDQISLFQAKVKGQGDDGAIYFVRTRKLKDGVKVLIKVKNTSLTDKNGVPKWDFRDVIFNKDHAYIFMCGNDSGSEYVMKPCLIDPEKAKIVMDDQQNKDGKTFNVTISMLEGSRGRFRIKTPKSKKKELFSVQQKYITEFFNTPK